MQGTALTARQEWRAHWPSVLAAAFGMSCATLYLYSAGVMVGPVEEATGWTRAQIGSGITITTVVHAILGPFVGSLLDRYGARRMAIAAMILFPLCFGAIGLTGPTLWHWWFHWALLGIIGFPIFPPTWTSAVTALFDRSRGFALAVTLSGMSVGSIAIPFTAELLTEEFGWRGAYLGLAAIWGGIGLPLVYFLLDDGRGKSKVDRAATAAKANRPSDGGASARAVLFSRQFVFIFIAVLAFTYVAMSFVFSIVPILVWQGIGRPEAAGLASLFGITAIIGRLTTGHLLDRIEPRLVTAVAMSLPIGAALLLGLSQGNVTAAAAAILLMGFALGAEVDAIAYLVSRYFGLRHYGLLFATAMSAGSLATAVSPVISGHIYDVTGGYELLLWIIVFPCILSGALITLLGPIPSPDEVASRTALPRDPGTPLEPVA